MPGLRESLDRPEPPAGLSPPYQAMWWLAHGGFALGSDWERAHGICQSAEGLPAADLVHALVHEIEGDRDNALYWYRRAGIGPGQGDPAAEWERVLGLLGSLG
jgi:hypothetical protein